MTKAKTTAADAERAACEKRLKAIAAEVTKVDERRSTLAEVRDDLIRELCTQHGVTMTRAAELAGMGRQNVSLILADPTRRDRLKKVSRDGRRERRQSATLGA